MIWWLCWNVAGRVTWRPPPPPPSPSRASSGGTGGGRPRGARRSGAERGEGERRSASTGGAGRVRVQSGDGMGATSEGEGSPATPEAEDKGRLVRPAGPLGAAEVRRARPRPLGPAGAASSSFSRLGPRTQGPLLLSPVSRPGCQAGAEVGRARLPGPPGPRPMCTSELRSRSPHRCTQSPFFWEGTRWGRASQVGTLAFSLKHERSLSLKT